MTLLSSTITNWADARITIGIHDACEAGAGTPTALVSAFIGPIVRGVPHAGKSARRCRPLVPPRRSCG